jgi:hypothetical protein
MLDELSTTIATVGTNGMCSMVSLSQTGLPADPPMDAPPTEIPPPCPITTLPVPPDALAPPDALEPPTEMEPPVLVPPLPPVISPPSAPPPALQAAIRSALPVKPIQVSSIVRMENF